MTREDILSILHSVVHPGNGTDIVTLGMVENLQVAPEKISLTLTVPQSRDPHAVPIKKSIEQAIIKAYPDFSGKVTVFIKEAPPKKDATPDKEVESSPLANVKNIIAISSAKGGVGKSTVTANLAVALTRMNYKVGILDADIYGPSQPTLFGVEDYEPVWKTIEADPLIIPAESQGVKLMSIGFFIDPDDALIWRGPMATNALKQLIHQTDWGKLDFLLIDMPPGTGDVHLTLISEMYVTGAIIVTTPQKVALADVTRGLSMFRSEKIDIPVLGIVENMAWFTPAELPDNRYYIFGKGGAQDLAKKENLKLLGEIPLVQSLREASDAGQPITKTDNASVGYFDDLAGNMIHQLNKALKK